MEGQAGHVIQLPRDPSCLDECMKMERMLTSWEALSVHGRGSAVNKKIGGVMSVCISINNCNQ